MIKIKNHSFKVSLSDMTVGEFEKASEIFNRADLLPVEKYISVIEFLNPHVPEDVIDNLTDKELFSIINHMQSSKGNSPKRLKEIEINGRKFCSAKSDKEFTLSARELAYLERVVHGGKEYYSNVLSVCFKEEGKESGHLDPEHLQEKQNLFKGLKASDYFHYVIFVSERITKNIEKQNNDK